MSELTSAVALRRCDDKLLTRRVLQEAGVAVAQGRLATFDDDDRAFLAAHGEIVVKPRRGEQGRGVTVGVVDEANLERAIADARDLFERRAPRALSPG